jgi:hypothetical protein
MNKETITQIFFMAIGIFSVLGAFFEWSFFFNSKRARFAVSLFGKSGARIFYIVVGVILFSIAFLDMIGVIDIHLLFGRRAVMKSILSK